MRTIAEQGHYAGRTKPTATRQGLYVALPDGRLLASINSTRPKDVLAMMKDAVAKFDTGDQSGFGKPEGSKNGDRNFDIPFPEGGMILRVTCRDLPRAGDPSFRTSMHNFDYAWLTAGEVKSFAPPGGDQSKPGDAYQIPKQVISRILRNHLIDHVKGEAPGWPPKSVEFAAAGATVVGRQGDQLKIELSGRVKCIRQPDGAVNEYSGLVNDSQQGIDLKLSGRLVWDQRSKKFTRFECVAYGDRWGTSRYNMRHHDRDKNPIGFTLRKLPVTQENMIEPKFLPYGYFN